MAVGRYDKLIEDLQAAERVCRDLRAALERSLEDLRACSCDTPEGRARHPALWSARCLAFQQFDAAELVRWTHERRLIEAVRADAGAARVTWSKPASVKGG